MRPARRFILAAPSSRSSGRAAQSLHPDDEVDERVPPAPRTLQTELLRRKSRSARSQIAAAYRGPCRAITPTSVKCPRQGDSVTACVAMTNNSSNVSCDASTPPEFSSERKLTNRHRSAASPLGRSPPRPDVVRSFCRRMIRLPRKPEASRCVHHGRAQSVRAYPVMRSTRCRPQAPPQARRQRSEELQQLVAPDRLADHNAPPKHQRRGPERRA